MVLYNCRLTNKEQNMHKETALNKYDDEMEMGEFLGDMYRGVSHIRTGVWLLVALEAAKFLLW